jgi:hypothetical protein
MVYRLNFQRTSATAHVYISTVIGQMQAAKAKASALTAYGTAGDESEARAIGL